MKIEYENEYKIEQLHKAPNNAVIMVYFTGEYDCYCGYFRAFKGYCEMKNFLKEFNPNQIIDLENTSVFKLYGGARKMITEKVVERITIEE